MRPFVSIVVVTHAAGEPLRACLGALDALRYPPDRFEVVLVDNASPPGPSGGTGGVSGAARERHPAVRTIASARNLGFAGGCNLGIAHSTGEYVALLNDDTRVEPGWLAALVDAAEADPRAGVCTSRILLDERGPEGALLQSTGAIVFADGSSRDRGYREPDRGQYAQREEVFAGCGASLLLRRAMLDDVGLLEESFFLYYEDTDLCWRARSRGWKVVYVPDSIVWHLHQATVGRGSLAHLFHSERNRLLLVLRNASAGRLLFVWARYAIGSIPGISRAAVPTGVRLRALFSALALLPRGLADRRRIQRRRSVPERDLAHWFRPLA